MAQSLPPVNLPRNTWVNLYASTGITVGTALIIQNIGAKEAILTESLDEPTSGYGHNKLMSRLFFINTDGNIGAWAYSSFGTKLQVEAS